MRFVEITKRGKVVRKPQIVIEYNKTKGGLDLADQMSSYSTPLRKSIRWYKKIGIDMLLNIALTNAHILYQSVNKKKIKMTDFRIAILKSKTRRNCGECYKRNVKNLGRL